MDPNGDFLSKITGLGKLLVGIIGLRYLMNPFALIGDILGLMDMMDNDPGMDPDPKTKPKPRITDALNLRRKVLIQIKLKEYRRLRDARVQQTLLHKQRNSNHLAKVLLVLFKMLEMLLVVD